MVNEDPAVEALAAIEHDQWAAWATTLLKSKDDKLSEGRRARWARLVVSKYEELSEEEKEHDRKWARKALDALGQAGIRLPPAPAAPNPAQP